MTDNGPQFTVTDRRKLTMEGEIRPEAARQEVPPPAPAAPADTPLASETRTAPPAQEGPTAQAAAGQEETLQAPTAAESQASSDAYAETTRQMDDVLRGKMPEAMRDNTAVGIEHIIQSLYMTAMMHLGAGTPPGEKVRVDLMGARQAIDMLDVLQKKTSGNLTEQEQRTLDTVLFEARMMFLEVTQAIARNATRPTGPQGKN